MPWRVFRLLRATGVAFVLAEVFYLVAMNAFLATSLFDKAINATPEAVEIHYARAWSFFPTRVHAEGLSIRGMDSHVEWILRLDQVDFDCSLLTLARKQFHVTRARGSGITFRARLKVASPAATREHVSQLPPIDSLGPVAFLPSEPPYPGTWDDAAWHLWTVRIDDAIAEHVREIWIEDGRFQGDARIAGGFYLKPIRAAEVGPAHIDVRSGSAALDGRTVAEPLAASIDFTLERFDPRTTSDAELLHHVSLSVDASTVVPALSDLGLELPDSGQVWGELDVPRLALRVVKGVVRDDTHVDARAASVALTTAAHVVSSGLDVTAGVANDRLTAHVALDHVEGDFALSIPRMTLDADSAALDLDGALADLHVVVDLPDAELRDAGRITSYLPKLPVRIMRGALRASAHVEAWRGEQRLRGSAKVRGTRLDVVATELDLRGGATLDASVGSLLWAEKRAKDVRLAIEIPEGRIASRASPDDPVVRVTQLRMNVEGADLELDRPLAALHASVVLRDGELFDRDSARAMLGVGRGLRLASRHAHFQASADVAFRGTKAEGTVDARAPHLGLEYEDRRLGLDLTAHGRAHAADWRSGKLSIDEARVEASRLVLSDATTPSALSIAHLSITAGSPRFDLEDPLARLQLLASIDGGRMRTATALGDLLPAGSIALASGAGATFDGDAAAEIIAHVARGSASVNARGLGVSSTRIHATGDVRIVADVARWDLSKRTLGGNVGVAVENVTGGFDQPGRAPDFTADRVDARASATELDLAHPSMRGVDYGLRVGRAQLRDARSLNAFLPSAAIMAIESGTALVSADIGTSSADHSGGGHLDVSLLGTGIRLHETHLAGDFSVQLHARGFDPDRAEVDLEGSAITMRNVRVTGATTDTSAWVGDLVLQKGTLGLSSPPRLEGDISLQARDASPLLAILLRDTLPKFMAVLTRMPKLTATTHLVVEPDSLLVTDLFAGGGDLAVRGTYVLHQEDLRAAFVVEKGPWSAGIRLANDGMHVRLFGLKGWYGQQWREALRAAGCGSGHAEASFCPKE